MASDNDPVRELLQKARISMLLSQHGAFYGLMATYMPLIDASDWCSTAATDGRNFYYNREFIKQLTSEERVFLFAHEVLHCIYDHLGRTGKRDPRYHNMATDYLINYTLKRTNMGKMPDSGLYDPAFTDEMSSEEIYDILVENSVEIKMPLDMHLSPGEGGGGSDGDDPSDGDQDGQGSGSGDQDGKGKGKGSVNVRVTGGANGPPTMSQEELEELRQQIQARLVQSVNQSGAGNLPLGVRRILQQLTESKIDWKTMLDAHIRSAVKDDYSFMRPSRRNSALGGNIILPGSDFMDTIKIAVCIDMSGSIGDEMAREMLSEVKGIMQTFPDFELEIWTFDTQVYGYKQFTQHNLDEIDYYEPKGGGGTSFEVNWEFMKKFDIQPMRFVMFTDGYPNGTWGDAHYVDTLFVIHGNTSIVSPFGTTCYYEEPKKVKRAA